MKNPMRPLTKDEYEALKEDIKEHGVVVPILVDENGETIDGHNRRQIAKELGIECPQMVESGLSDTEKLARAISLNANRRQMTYAQKKAAAEELKKRNYSNRQIGKMLAVSHTAVNKWFSAPDFVTDEKEELKVKTRFTTGNSGNSFHLSNSENVQQSQITLQVSPSFKADFVTAAREAGKDLETWIIDLCVEASQAADTGFPSDLPF